MPFGNKTDANRTVHASTLHAISALVSSYHFPKDFAIVGIVIVHSCPIKTVRLLRYLTFAAMSNIVIQSQVFRNHSRKENK